MLVTIVQSSLPHYRVPFFEALRLELGRHGVALRLIYSPPSAKEASKNDTSSLSWALQVPKRVVAVGPRGLYWQPCVALLQGSDLVIVEQASKLLLNYVLLARQALGGMKVAFWGHGRNFQRDTASRLGEMIKRRTSRWPHWWFAYTEGSAELVRRLPYSPDRITVVQNAIDTSALQSRHRLTSEEELTALRRLLGIESRNVAIFVGGLYAEKRISFLLEAAHILRLHVPDFELIVIGAGPDQEMVEAAAREQRWIHYHGARLGSDKVPYFCLARVMLLPGLVGLGILDSFALETPLVTVDLSIHSPEIEYLHHGENGLMLGSTTTPARYATAVANLLSDQAYLQQLRGGCRAAAAVYTLDAMVGRFAQGVLAALDGDIPARIQ